ncbi:MULTISPECIES: TldD/PmbA family protein [unclassified Anaeromyxobacter]|uniref:TldD/PmbA family protein n=1 Tax=unclassified Anaeromyxobacter TaxID=2620896 RepID=UPI001F56D03B|nr:MULTISPECIES: TldD/PmbA family protein [unclassified Anaeromyxobacter]
MSDLLDITRRAAALAREKGATDASAGSYRARHVEVAWRDGKVEKVSEATTRGLGLDLYVDGRYAAVSTSDLRPDALDRFVEDAVALARTLAPDPHRRLPDPELYRGQANVDLQLEDPDYGKVDATRRRAEAEAIEAAARGVPGASAILSVTTSVSDTRSESALVQTNGFEGQRRGTDFWIGAEVTVLDPDGRRPEEYAASGGRFRSAMETPEAIGRRAAERAIARIGTRKGESAVLTMALDNRASGRMVGMLFGPLAAAAIQQKRSFLEGKIGVQLGSPLLTVKDDPLVPRGLGSRLYDGEGIAARPFPVFEEGVLRSYYVDTYYGRKLGLPPTTSRSSNLAWALGGRSQAQLLTDLGEGVLVTGFLGGNSNGTTGDFSLGVRGFRVRGGRLAEPVGEMNVSGNHLELWKRLAAVGDDPYPYSAMRTPTLVFEGVQFAGT